MSAEGLTAVSLPPGWRLLKPAAYPCDPCLYLFDRQFFEPETPHRLAYGAVTELAGYSLSPVSANEPFTLKTHWRLLNDVQETIHVFVHVVDESGQVVAQHDGPLVADMLYYLEHYPEELFPAGSAVRLEHPLPPLPPGNYRVHAGLYRWPSQERIPVVSADGATGGDYPLLFTLPITE